MHLKTRLYRYLSALYGLQAIQLKELKVGRLLELNDPLDSRPNFYSLIDPDKDVDHLAHVGVHNFQGVLCFSKISDSLPMWTHYGEGHKGIVLGFDIDDGDFHPVLYENDRPRINLDEFDGPETDSHLTQAYTKKAPSWSYESEARFFVPLEGCRIWGPNYFVPLEKLRMKLREVLIGVNSELYHSDVRRSLAGFPDGNSVVVQKLRISKTSFMLDREAEY